MRLARAVCTKCLWMSHVIDEYYENINYKNHDGLIHHCRHERDNMTIVSAASRQEIEDLTNNVISKAKKMREIRKKDV